MFAKWSLKARLMVAFAGMAVFVGAVGTIGYESMKSILESFDHIYEVNIPKSATVAKIYINEKDVVMFSLTIADSHDQAVIDLYEKRLQDAFKEHANLSKDYLKKPFGPGEEVLWQAVVKDFEPLVGAVEKIEAFAKRHDAKAESERDKYLDGDFRRLRVQLRDSLVALLDYQTNDAQRLVMESVKVGNNSIRAMFLFSLLGFLGALGIGFFLARSLAQTLNTISGEIGEAANYTASASSQLSDSSQQLSSGSVEAAASLEETVASLEEISSIVKLNAEHAKQAGELSQKSRDSAEKGEQEISKLIGAMGEMAQGSKQIEEIIAVIDDIAFQTNLLALNAAVEAARAGEQGRGFAVVAEAVRHLAQKSASAAKDIAQLIKDSVHKGERGSKIADESGVMLKEIVGSVKRVAELNNQIASASAEQYLGITQINKAMDQLDRASQANASSAEEVAASAEEMSSQASSLQNLVKELREVVYGQGKSVMYNEGVSSHHKPRVLRALPTTPIHNKRSTKVDSSQVIPFDGEGDAAPGKVGTTDGF